MAITYNANVALFEETVSVEEAEGLLQWIQVHPEGVADLSGCTHIHAADLQVLMASAMAVTAWPRDDGLNAWLTTALAR